MRTNTGNYWDDYIGSDADDDGIDDTSYSIDSDDADNYPLMGTWESYFAPVPLVFDTGSGTLSKHSGNT